MKTPKISEIYQAYMYSYPHKTEYGALENIDVFDYLNSCDSDGIDFYFHIPFCVSKCGYCNLFSVAGQNAEFMDRYLTAMETQISQYGIDGLAPGGFTVGGGTPLVLAERQLDRLFGILPDMNKALGCVETSPDETTKEKLKILKTYEIDRVSIGVQSFEDSELETLKRAQSAGSARRALELLKKYDFAVLNIDLIYGIPGQTLSSSKASINEALRFEPDELFIYPLYIREGTDTCSRFGVDYLNSNIFEMYLRGRDQIMEAGYTQISMRRFVKNPPFVSGSCGFRDILSIGCGGRSYLGNLHFCHPFTMDNNERLRIIDGYVNASDKTSIVNGYILNNHEQKRRFVIKNLLHVYGVSFSDYTDIYHTDIRGDFPIFGDLAEKGYVYEADGRIQLTPAGLSLSDYIGPMLRGDSSPVRS